jgi:hypothetical protein
MVEFMDRAIVANCIGNRSHDLLLQDLALVITNKDEYEAVPCVCLSHCTMEATSSRGCGRGMGGK